LVQIKSNSKYLEVSEGVDLSVDMGAGVGAGVSEGMYGVGDDMGGGFGIDSSITTFPFYIDARMSPVGYRKDTVIYDRKRPVYSLCISSYTVTVLYDPSTRRNTVVCGAYMAWIWGYTILYTIVCDSIQTS
jgi:hypothetical protein